MEGIAQVRQIMSATGQIPPAPIIVADFKSRFSKIHVHTERFGRDSECHPQKPELHVTPAVRSASDLLIFMEFEIAIRMEVRLCAIYNQHFPWLNGFT